MRLVVAHCMKAINSSFPSEADSVFSTPRIEKWLLPLIFRYIGRAPVRLILGNGKGLSPQNVTPRFTIWIRDVRTAVELLINPEVAFGDAFTDGRIQVIGDLPELLEELYASIAEANKSPGWYAHAWSKWFTLWQANSLEGSRHNIHRHYDLGNDFYRLWLDSQLVYTCAYFRSNTMTLEEAQAAKLDYVCRKLRLRRGEAVVEAGCGWGALALHMARSYGVRVKAFNISHEQIVYARQRAKEENLGHRVEFIEDDYRNVSGQFDVFVSLGMLEHVGPENYAGFGSVIHRVTGDRGRGLLHFIGRTGQSPFSSWTRKRIFPGAHAPSLRDALKVLEPYGYFVRDVEDLRPHYARTLEHWLKRYEKSADQVAASYGAEFERAWKLYLAGSIAGFRTGTLQLFQVVFTGAKCASPPWTRDGLYSTPPTSPTIQAPETSRWTAATS